MVEPQLMNFLVALGIGLLVGIERERRKGSGPSRAAAGLRTFSAAALLGAVCVHLESGLLPVVMISLALLCMVSARASQEGGTGLTTEVALLLTTLLGALAMTQPGLAAALGVTLAALLAARTRLHHFVKAVITEHELHDGLILLAASLVILPLMPDRHLGPFDAINPRTTWMIAVLVLLAGALGHAASRSLGPRLGLPAAGFAAGFASSTATVAAMGSQASRDPRYLHIAACAAIASSLATFVQLAMVLAVTSQAVLSAMLLPLAGAALVTTCYVVLGAMGSKGAVPERDDAGSAVSIPTALVLAVLLTGTMLLSATMEAWLGRAGAIAAAVLSGFADVHSAAASAASLAATARLDPDSAAFAVLAAITANTLSKLVSAAVTGGSRFLMAVLPGLCLGPLAAWGAWLLAR